MLNCSSSQLHARFPHKGQVPKRRQPETPKPFPHPAKSCQSFGVKALRIIADSFAQSLESWSGVKVWSCIERWKQECRICGSRFRSSILAKSPRTDWDQVICLRPIVSLPQAPRLRRGSILWQGIATGSHRCAGEVQQRQFWPELN